MCISPNLNHILLEHKTECLNHESRTTFQAYVDKLARDYTQSAILMDWFLLHLRAHLYLHTCQTHDDFQRLRKIQTLNFYLYVQFCRRCDFNFYFLDNFFGGTSKSSYNYSNLPQKQYCTNCRSICYIRRPKIYRPLIQDSMDNVSLPRFDSTSELPPVNELVV